MKFVFKAKTKSGDIKEGLVDAVNQNAAIEVLQKNELFPIIVREEQKSDSLEKLFLRLMEKVDEKDLMIFFRQLSILIEAKVPIVSALTAISEQTVNKYFHKIIEQMINDIEEGLPFSDALAKNKNVFSPLSINIIRAGEVSGTLKKAVDYVAENIEKNYAFSSKVKSAMLYPLIILVVFSIIAFLVGAFVVPKLTEMIKSLNATIPWYTQVVITISDFMAAYWWAILIMIFGFIAGAVYYVKTEDGRKELDQWKINLPIFGVIFRYIYVTRFAENLAVLLTGGIPIIRALQVVSSVINNAVYEAIILKAAEEVKSGGNMSEVLEKYSEFPPIVAQMVKIGEESGQIDLVLRHVAKFYGQEADDMTKNLSTLIEPVLMVVIGLAVGLLAFAVIMPIYNIAGQL